MRRGAAASTAPSPAAGALGITTRVRLRLQLGSCFGLVVMERRRAGGLGGRLPTRGAN